MKREDIEKRLEEIFGKGSRQEIEKAETNEKIAERIEEMATREEQFIVWERMKGKQRSGSGKTRGSTPLENEQELPCPVWWR